MTSIFMRFFISLIVCLGFINGVNAEDEAPTDIKTSKSAYLQLKPTITTNYISERLKYVRADVALRVDGAILDKVTHHSDAIRDIVIMLFSRQDKDVFTDTENIAALRGEVKEEIIAFLESENEPTDVIDVLFMSLLVE